MRIYLAAPYGSRAQIVEYAAQLTRIGYEVTSTWLHEDHEITPGTEKAAVDLTDKEVAKHAAADLTDVDRSRLLVVFTEASVGVKGGGGRHVETGFAMARHKEILVVGEPENIFHRMGGSVQVVPDWHEALIELSHRLVHHERQQARTVDEAVMAR